MFEDDSLPHFTPKKLLPRPLDGLSGEELQEYLVFLSGEKLRTEQALSAKGGISQAAEALFRKS